VDVAEHKPSRVGVEVVVGHSIAEAGAGAGIGVGANGLFMELKAGERIRGTKGIGGENVNEKREARDTHENYGKPLQASLVNIPFLSSSSMSKSSSLI